MAAQGTTLEVLKDMPLIKEILHREILQGCLPKEGAEERIQAALVKAVEKEVLCA